MKSRIVYHYCYIPELGASSFFAVGGDRGADIGTAALDLRSDFVGAEFGDVPDVVLFGFDVGVLYEDNDFIGTGVALL